MPGDWVLTQGSGGVSIFALQFAKAAGAKVIATTSSTAKGERLKKMGADHVINYKEDETWGETAKKLTGGRGVQHILELGGPNTMHQSFAAIGFEGVITIIGAVGGRSVANQPSFLECVPHIAIIRGVFVGSRMQFEAMNSAIEANNIKPVIDEKVFRLEEAKDAYQVSVDVFTILLVANHRMLTAGDSICGSRNISGSCVSQFSKSWYTKSQNSHQIQISIE